MSKRTNPLDAGDESAVLAAATLALTFTSFDVMALDDDCRQILAAPTLDQASVVLMAGPSQSIDTTADGQFIHTVRDHVLLASVQSTLEIKRMEDALRESEQRFQRLYEAVASRTDGSAIIEQSRCRPTGCHGRTVTTTADRDASHRRPAERELTREGTDFRMVADFTYDWESWKTPEGELCYVSPACERMTGYTAREFMEDSHLFREILLPEDREVWDEHRRKVVEHSGLHEVQFRIRRRDGEICWIEHGCQPVVDDQGQFRGFRASNRDITDRKMAESERNITVELLGRAGVARSLDELLGEITPLLQHWSGCEAVGVRLRKDGDFPYYGTQGFPSDFVMLENSLLAVDAHGNGLRDHCGHPVLECMCGNVIRGRFDPKLPFFTERGSFWTNSTSELLASTTKAERQARTRNRCHGEGYESVALIPLRASGETLGLLQFNDRRRHLFTEARIRLFERLGHNIALAVAQQQAVEALRTSEQRLQDAFAEIETLKDRLNAENIYLQEEIKASYGFDEIVGRSDPLQLSIDKIEQVAVTDATVLLCGETGTGKELFARAIHDRSRRKDRPLVKVDCGALPSTLIESELFGHVVGAFTGAVSDKLGRFELADGGTIFLDEIGELHPDLQTKLLRVLQDGVFERVGSAEAVQVDVRVIAATNRDLHRAMEAGMFRPDLYYRLAVFPIEVPPLRQRREDIPLLAWHFIAKKQRRLGKTISDIPKSVLEMLVNYNWPGNVRELENVIERSMILSPGPTLVLSETLAKPASRRRPSTTSSSLEDIDRTHIVDVLDDCNWKIKGANNAADRLGLAPSTLRHRMKRLGIEPAPRQAR